MKLWSDCFKSVKEVRPLGIRPRKSSEAPSNRQNSGAGAPPSAGNQDGNAGVGEDWWDEVSHQAQRVAHVAAASAFAAGGREVRLRRRLVALPCHALFGHIHESSFLSTSTAKGGRGS